MKVFFKRFSFLVAVLMMFAMLVVVLPASAADVKMVWDFKDATTEDIATWESEAILWCYEPWSTADLAIENGKMVINHMTQETGCNSLDLMINKNSEDYSGYKSIAFWLDASQVGRPFTVKVSIIDAAKNNIGVASGTTFYLYPDNGVKTEKKAGGDGNWVFFNLPYQFKGYIEVPFENFKVLNWKAENVKNVDKEVLSAEFRVLFEFNNAKDGEVTKLDDVQLVKSGNPQGWVQGTASSQAPPASSAAPSSQQPGTSSAEPVVSDESQISESSDGATGSNDSSVLDESSEESQTSAANSSKPTDEKDDNNGLIVALVIIGVAVIAGGGFAAYKFIFSKK